MMLVVEAGTDPPPQRARSALAGEVPVAGPRVSEGRRGQEFEFLWFGDCAALIAESEHVTVIGETITKRGQEAARAKSWAKALDRSSATGRAEFMSRHRAARNHINSGRHWLFSPDVRAASHVSQATRSLKPGALLLLASDGFLALVSDYGAYDIDGLMAAVRGKGLAVLGEELRAIEDVDSAAEKFPRFKKSDDATALVLEVIAN